MQKLQQNQRIISYFAGQEIEQRQKGSNYLRKTIRRQIDKILPKFKLDLPNL